MPSPINPLHTNANALNGGAKNEVKDAKNAPKSASKDFSKILNQKISKDKTAPKELSSPSALKDAKTLEKTPTLPYQHAQNLAKNQQAPTLKDWLNHPKTHPTAEHEAQHETHEVFETDPKNPNETLSKNEKKPNEVASNAHQANLTNKNPITPNRANKTPTTPTHNAKDPKTLKDIQTLSQKHDLNASNIQAATTPENKTPLSASDQLTLKATQTPTNHTLAKNDAKNTANLSSVLQSLEKKESLNKEHANPQNSEKKTPPLKEALEMNAIKRDKTLSKKKSEKTPIHAKTQTTAPSATPENAPKLPLKTPPLMPLIGANPPPNDNIPTPLEKEEKTKEMSDNKEKAKETSNSAQSTQNTQASDKTSDNKSIAPKETIKHFTQQLKQEIQEYKPPMSKISMDLFPKELGKVEVTIQKVGKNLKVSVISHNNSLQTFLDNQQDLKNSLNALGFEGVDLSFSQDSSKEQQAPKDQPKEPFKEQELTPLKENALKSYQENTDHENQETSMQITLYA
ncbi:flagellar hook-length control protein [Helicobacter pylori GAM83Bi]|uniref:flagellar hook-length control protein FliK n=1 Tax=Helicobacter pylori TaxID=210 RepID=UPI0002B9ABF1|nr:flagellar hook-length control protein FliK [Helicobacter pylori]EMH35848.1 flagellar hook-length control protein [Helicobacter pylori GAM83Bi]EMH37357.1 flagellar hook-length control protein [Helicobacter pylori GAM83T]